jgi:NAD(P)-dependent dehydrogenase (short-subunit alcohol dehydrogenase family)
MRFQDKVAIVTGGNSGMGKEVARRFVTEGGRVVVNGRNAAKTEAAVKEIDPSGKRAIAHVGDIALPATGDAVVKVALDRFGRLDMLFNNAGIFAPKPFLEVDETEYDRFVDNILKGSFFAAQAAAKAMKAAGRGGAIVQTGSMWALQAIGATPSAAYSAAESRHRAGARQHSRECDRTRRDRDAGVQHLPHGRAGRPGAPDLQHDASPGTQRSTRGCRRGPAVSRLRSGEVDHRGHPLCRRRRYGWPAVAVSVRGVARKGSRGHLPLSAARFSTCVCPGELRLSTIDEEH